MLFEISHLRPFCKHSIAVTVSEDADVIDCMFVQTRVEHSDVVATQIEALSCVFCSVHSPVEHGNTR